MIVIDTSALVAILNREPERMDALAKTMNAPLLFKGDAFAATDVQLA
jgi:uncharacterized protein with PIN domain